MSWIPSSKGIGLAVLLAISLAVVGPAAAIDVTQEDVPDESQVGESVDAIIVIEDPFQDMPDTWTLRGSTELTNVSWTVTVLQQGNQMNQTVSGDQEFEKELDFDNGGDEIRVEISGTTPEIENYTYEPEERYTLADFDQVTGSNVEDLNETTVHHFTNDSKEARNAIDDAAAAINESGGNSEAQNDLDQAISAYESGNFENARSNAQDAQDQAEQAQQSQQTMQLALYAVAGLVVLGLIGGGIYYWRSQQDDYSKLQ